MGIFRTISCSTPCIESSYLLASETPTKHLARVSLRMSTPKMSTPKMSTLKMSTSYPKTSTPKMSTPKMSPPKMSTFIFLRISSVACRCPIASAFYRRLLVRVCGDWVHFYTIRAQGLWVTSQTTSLILSNEQQNFRSWHFGSWHFGSWHFGKNPVRK